MLRIIRCIIEDWQDTDLTRFSFTSLFLGFEGLTRFIRIESVTGPHQLKLSFVLEARFLRVDRVVGSKRWCTN